MRPTWRSTGGSTEEVRLPTRARNGRWCASTPESPGARSVSSRLPEPGLDRERRPRWMVDGGGGVGYGSPRTGNRGKAFLPTRALAPLAGPALRDRPAAGVVPGRPPEPSKPQPACPAGPGAPARGGARAHPFPRGLPLGPGRSRHPGPGTGRGPLALGPLPPPAPRAAHAPSRGPMRLHPPGLSPGPGGGGPAASRGLSPDLESPRAHPGPEARVGALPFPSAVSDPSQCHLVPA